MLPNNATSATPQVAPFLYPDRLRVSPLEDWEDGGVGIQDPSQGLSGYRWRCYTTPAGIWLQRDGLPAQLWVVSPGTVKELAFAFDQNMRPVVAYTLTDNTVRLLWFDTLASAYTTTSYGTTIRNPRLCLDDKRDTQSLTSDVIFAYIKGTDLCYRMQRDRYTIERILAGGLTSEHKLRNIGMTTNLRLRFSVL